MPIKLLRLVAKKSAWPIVTTGMGGKYWVYLNQLLPLPKKGDKITYVSKHNLLALLVGIVDECADDYVVVRVKTSEGKNLGTDYVYYSNIKTVNGKPW